MTKTLEAMTFDSGYAHGHKAGWEQAKREAVKVAESCKMPNYQTVMQMAQLTIKDAIAAMEYKEPTND